MSAAVLKARQDIGEKLPTTRVWPSINWQFPASPRTTPLLAQMAPNTERSDQQKSQHYWYRPPNRQALTFFCLCKRCQHCKFRLPNSPSWQPALILLSYGSNEIRCETFRPYYRECQSRLCSFEFDVSGRWNRSGQVHCELLSRVG